MNIKDQVIDLVYDTPVIWDKFHKQHHNRHALTREWRKISAKLGVSEKEARNCWKNLRQEFSKQKRKWESRSGDVALHNSLIVWPYFQKLLFLEDQFANPEMHRDFTGGLEDSSALSVAVGNNSSEINAGDYDDDCMELPSPKFENCSPPDAPPSRVPTPVDLFPTPSPTPLSSSFVDPVPGPSNTRRSQKRRMAPEPDVEIQETDLEEDEPRQKMSNVPHDLTNDEDMCFFRSILPYVKKLSSKKKFLFRMKIQKDLFDLSFPSQE